MQVKAITCPRCKDTIYSRAGHDFHSCTCGDVSVDGGPKLERVLWQAGCGFEQPKPVEVTINATPQELYDDWNNRVNRFGVIPALLVE